MLFLLFFKVPEVIYQILEDSSSKYDITEGSEADIPQTLEDFVSSLKGNNRPDAKTFAIKLKSMVINWLSLFVNGFLHTVKHTLTHFRFRFRFRFSGDPSWTKNSKSQNPRILIPPCRLQQHPKTTPLSRTPVSHRTRYQRRRPPPDPIAGARAGTRRQLILPFRSRVRQHPRRLCGGHLTRLQLAPPWNGGGSYNYRSEDLLSDAGVVLVASINAGGYRG